MMLSGKNIVIASSVIVVALLCMHLETFSSKKKNEVRFQANICDELIGVPLEEISAQEISVCNQESPILKSYVRKFHVTPPSSLVYPYPKQQPSDLAWKVWPILKAVVACGQEQKVFVEARAYNGFNNSNTLWLEQTHGFTGVLIECSPTILPTLHKNRRKAFIVDACPSTTSHAVKEILTTVDGFDELSWIGDNPLMSKFPPLFMTNFEVQTIPVFAALAAIEIDKVDFFRLSVQSRELLVLRKFPFHLVNVKVWVVEVALLTPKDKKALMTLMLSQGYEHNAFISKMLGDEDWVFVQKKNKGRNWETRL